MAHPGSPPGSTSDAEERTDTAEIDSVASHLSSLGITTTTSQTNDEQMDRRYPLLLVLDLNGTLIDRITKSHRHRDYANVQLPTPDVVLAGAWVYRRPNLSTFLEYILDHFYVATWTSATVKSSDLIVNDLFSQEQRRQLVFSWTRDDCTDISGPENNYEAKKNLESVWGVAWNRKAGKPYTKVPLNARSNTFSQNRKDIAFSSRNTVLIDDSIGKASHNPRNCLLIPTYTVANETHASDDAFLKIITYLESIRTEYPLDQSVEVPNATTPERAAFEDVNRAIPGVPVGQAFDVRDILSKKPCFPK